MERIDLKVQNFPRFLWYMLCRGSRTWECLWTEWFSSVDPYSAVCFLTRSLPKHPLRCGCWPKCSKSISCHSPVRCQRLSSAAHPLLHLFSVPWISSHKSYFASANFHEVPSLNHCIVLCEFPSLSKMVRKSSRTDINIIVILFKSSYKFNIQADKRWIHWTHMEQNKAGWKGFEELWRRTTWNYNYFQKYLKSGVKVKALSLRTPSVAGNTTSVWG